MESNLKSNVSPTSFTQSGLIMVDSKIFEIPNNQGSTEWTSYGKLFAIGLPFDTKEIHIRRHFEQFGLIRRVEMSKSHPEYCFVIYEKRKGLIFALRQKVHFITTNSRNSFKTIIVKAVGKSKKFEAAIDANCKITTVKKEENSDKKKTEEKIRKEAFEALEKLKNAIEALKIQQNIRGQANWKNRLDFMYSLRYSPLSKISSSNNKNLELILINSGIPLRTSFTSEALEKLMNAIEAQKIQQNIRRQGNWKNRIDFLYSLRNSPLSTISPANNEDQQLIVSKTGKPLRTALTTEYC